MRHPLLSACLVGLGFSIAYSQIGGPQYPPGGGYPPGQYPPGSRTPQGGAGIPWPKTKAQKKKEAEKEKKKQEEENLVSLRGGMRRLTEKELIIETKDKRIIRIACAEETKYLKKDTSEIKGADLQPGDRLWVEASQDEKGMYRATRVTREQEGSSAERVAARDRVTEIGTFEDKAEGKADEAESKRDGDQPPKMKRAQSKDSAPDKVAEKTAEKAADREAAAKPAEEERVVATLRLDSTPADDEDKPKLTRRRPAQGNQQETREVAEVRRPPDNRPMVAQPPPLPATPEPEVVVERAVEPDPAEKDGDPFIGKAREMATDFTETLPSYLAKQLTTRYIAQSLKAGFQVMDTISADLVYENGTEHYKNVLLKGKPAKGKVEETGSWSRGEFGTVVRDLFSRGTAADFRSSGSGILAGRTARTYRFTVDQENSHWQITGGSQTYLPAYRGTVWLDRETARVLRIEMQAMRLPKEFPIDTLESATEFEFVRLGTASFLLPTHAETLSCIRGTSQCSKNSIDFRNYKKFGAESNITFQP